jgi:hypothetical protein
VVTSSLIGWQRNRNIEPKAVPATDVSSSDVPRRIRAGVQGAPLTTDDSTLFSLDRLTRQRAQALAAAPAEDSGLIDLDKLTEAAQQPVAKPPSSRFEAPPPLLARAEESTLAGLSAVTVEPRKPRWWLAGYAVLVAVVGLALGVLLDGLLDAPRAQVTPATTVVVVAAPPVATSEPRSEDRGDAPATPASSDVIETKKPAATPKPRPRSRSTSRSPKTPAVTTKAPKSESKSPARSDPCAHCNGDLACAMRCSVKRSK